MFRLALISLNNNIRANIQKIINMSNKDIDFIEKMELFEDDDFSYIIQKSRKDLFFLKRKRKPIINSSFNRISQERKESFLIEKSTKFNLDNNKHKSNGIKFISKSDDIKHQKIENHFKDNEINRKIKGINNIKFSRNLNELNSNYKENESKFQTIKETMNNNNKNIQLPDFSK